MTLQQALDEDLATMGWNPCPEGWVRADFEDCFIYKHPSCPKLDGEI